VSLTVPPLSLSLSLSLSLRDQQEILNYLTREKRKLGRGSEGHYSWGGGGTERKLAVLKVPRQCPLVLLVEARLVCGICSILIFKEVGAAAMGRNVV
jgi:hypothetical protein